MGSCRRPLYTRVLAEEFVENILGYRDRYDSVVTHIVENENTLTRFERYPTLSYEDYRIGRYRTQEQRLVLQEKILGELINFKRLDNDDDIRLGRGGAKPENTIKNSQAYIVTGPPASGKSSIATRLADETGSYIIDSDYAKRKIPEYKSNGGASLVHEESDSIVFNPENGLFVYCLYNKFNIVIPLVGKTQKSVERITNKLVSFGYSIHIVNVCLDRYKCAIRACKRFEATKRYVPLSYIFDEVGNEPERIYFLLKRKYATHQSFTSFSQISTDVRRGQPNVVLEVNGASPILSWKDYLWQKEG